MTTIRVEVGRGYDVVIEDGLLARCAGHLAPHARQGRFIVAYDTNVAVHLAVLTQALAEAGIRVDAVPIAPGEGSKDWTGLAHLVDRLIALEVERADAVVALGGGVIGDLTGFACAIVKRGCRFIQIPTTLLAQVDSSVGGKTAINTAAGKNLVGAFHQPELVLIDPRVLETLGERELRAGYSEVLKYGLIDDPEFYRWCEENGAALLAGDIALRTHAIAGSISAKARIVAADERETKGVRALLNLGHTFGHALEAQTGFGDRLLHGEAVAAGMALAFRFSAARGLCTTSDAARVADHLATVGLPTGARSITAVSGATLAAHMAHDKKRSGGRVPFLLARGIGRTFLADDVELAEVAAFLDADAN